MRGGEEEVVKQQKRGESVAGDERKKEVRQRNGVRGRKGGSM